MTPDALNRYHNQHADDRTAQRTAAAAQAEAAADIAAELFLDEIAITARATWPGVSYLSFALHADGRTTLYAVDDADGNLMLLLPEPPSNPDSPRSAQAAAVIAGMFHTALSFSPTIAEPAEGHGDTTHYRLALPARLPSVIPLEPSPYGATDMWDSPTVLRITCRRTGADQFGVIYTGPHGKSRGGFGDPKTPGPHARLYALPSVIDGHRIAAAETARRREAGLDIYAHPGDTFLIGGELFELRDDQPGKYPRLVLIGPPTR